MNLQYQRPSLQYYLVYLNLNLVYLDLNLQSQSLNLQPQRPELATLETGTCNLTERKFTISFYFFVNGTLLVSWSSIKVLWSVSKCLSPVSKLVSKCLSPVSKLVSECLSQVSWSSTQLLIPLTSLPTWLLSTSTWLLFPLQTVMTNSCVLSYFSFNSSVFHVKVRVIDFKLREIMRTVS